MSRSIVSFFVLSLTTAGCHQQAEDPYPSLTNPRTAIEMEHAKQLRKKNRR